MDRGGGFYNGTGRITTEFKQALRANDFTAFHGDDAKGQPGRSGDLWLHETSVSWIRERLERSLPKDPWNESEEAFTKRMKKAVEYVNREHNVPGLCREMPSRMRDLVHVTRGDRLRK